MNAVAARPIPYRRVPGDGAAARRHRGDRCSTASANPKAMWSNVRSQSVCIFGESNAGLAKGFAFGGECISRRCEGHSKSGQVIVRLETLVCLIVLFCCHFILFFGTRSDPSLGHQLGEFRLFLGLGYLLEYRSEPCTPSTFLEVSPAVLPLFVYFQVWHAYF